MDIARSVTEAKVLNTEQHVLRLLRREHIRVLTDF